MTSRVKDTSGTRMIFLVTCPKKLLNIFVSSQRQNYLNDVKTRYYNSEQKYSAVSFDRRQKNSSEANWYFLWTVEPGLWFTSLRKGNDYWKPPKTTLNTKNSKKQFSQKCTHFSKRSGVLCNRFHIDETRRFGRFTYWQLHVSVMKIAWCVEVAYGRYLRLTHYSALFHLLRWETTYTNTGTLAKQGLNWLLPIIWR